jgi:tetratricopeptide (TPR) repeat protein
VLSARANVHRALGEFDAADKLFRRVVEETEQAFGGRAIELAGALNELGVNCKYWGRFDEGEQLYLQAMEIALGALGSDRNPLVAGLHHNLGGLEHARGNYAAAEPHARRAVELRRAMAPEHLSLALDEGALAAILDGLGQRDEAEQLLRSAIVTLERAPEAHRHELAVTLNNLAAIRYRLGDLDEAAVLYGRALAIKRQLLETDSPELAVSLNNLALVLAKRGSTEEALAMYDEALALFHRGLNATHPSIAKCTRNYAKLLREAGRPDQAATLEAELAEIPAE